MEIFVIRKVGILENECSIVFKTVIEKVSVM